MHAEALAHLQGGRPRVAAELLKSHLARASTDGSAWFLLGACHHALGELTAAASAFTRSLTFDPENAEAHRAHIAVLRASGDAAGALAASTQALRRVPGDVGLLYAAALCLEDLGRLNEALAHYDAALQLAPRLEEALHNRGLLLARLGRHEEAVENQRRYLAAYPGSAGALAGLADELLSLSQYEAALDALQELKRVSPEDVAVDVRIGIALAALRRLADARQVLDAARARDAEGVDRYVQRVAPGAEPAQVLSPESIYICRSWTRLEQCDWSAWDATLSEMRAVASGAGITVEPAVAFMSRLLPLSGMERHAVVRKITARIDSQHPTLAALAPAPRHRVRIGVMSPDFREHLNAYLLLPLFELVDRAKFELYAYSLVPDTGSWIGKQIRERADTLRELHGLTDTKAAQAIRHDDIDILVDAGGLTSGSRYAITAQRPARLQVSYLGFTCSLASHRVDYAIADRVVDGDENEWSESRAYLPHTHFLYDFRAPAPSLNVTRRDYGLPERAFVFCAFHRADKITPDVFALWMRVLERTEGSVLWFRGLSESAIRSLRIHATHHGVNPDRLVVAPFEPSQDPRYLARHRLGDLMLDSLHHNAMTSACDALGMGLPMLTLPGDAMAARAGASLVRAAWLPELVADNEDDYVNKAVRLATQPSTIKAMKERLQAGRRTAPLFDTVGRVRALEAAFQQMYDRMMRGERPTSFDVEV
ncbi:MAG: tetratricopeptide repeat protein [Gammaproteobacteria bacterium]